MAQHDADNARAELDAAKAAMDQAKKDLDDSVVRAEASGRVGRAMFEVGGRVTGPADLLTTIDELDPAYVVFRPSSQQVLNWKADPRSAPVLEPGGKLEVHVVLANGEVLPRTGRLTFVAPSLDSTTGTQEFRSTFENHDRLLLPGQFVNVRLLGILTRERARGSAARRPAGTRTAVRVRRERGRYGRRARREDRTVGRPALDH